MIPVIQKLHTASAITMVHNGSGSTVFMLLQSWISKRTKKKEKEAYVYSKITLSIYKVVNG